MSDPVIQEIKSRLDIVPFIQGYVKLSRAGINWKGLCPFHSEKTPSFIVSPTRQTWHCFGCFPPGQKVKTPFGYHNIEELDENHYVYSGRGEIRKILATQTRNYNGTLVDIQIRKLDGIVSMTEDHRLSIIRPKTTYRKRTKQFYRRVREFTGKNIKNLDILAAGIRKHGTFMEISAGELKRGDFLLYPINYSVTELNEIDLKDYLIKSYTFGPRVRKVPYVVKVNEDFLKLIGYYIAEGSSHRAYIRFSLGSHEEKFAKEIVDLIKRIFGLKAAIHRRSGKKTGIEITACHAYLANIFENFCGKGAEYKHIPFIFQGIDPKLQLVLVNAIHKGDGTTYSSSRSKVTRKNYVIGVVSRILIEQIVDILLRNNIFPTTNIYPAKMRKGVNHKESYRVHWLDEARSQHRFIFKDSDSYSWLLPIKKIEPKLYSGPVFNLTIDEDHSYIATNFAVANCGRGGDIFKFIMELENLEFRDALKQLAERAGVELVREDPNLRTERERLSQICEEAANFYEIQLERVPAVREYLKKRGVTPETMKEFRLGYAPDSWDATTLYLKRKGFQDDELVRAGFSIKSERRASSYYDRFRNRVMFPIFDGGGRVIAFSGRVFERIGAHTGASEAKYINSPQSLIYDKSRSFYGIHKAKEAIRKNNRVVVVEGQMDLVMSHQAGVKEAVAVSGTALTPFHLQQLKRLTDTFVASFDTDQAGETATRRSFDLAAEFDFNRRVALIPKGKDPADAILENPEVWQQSVEGSRPWMEFYMERAMKKFSREAGEGKKEFSRYILPEIAKIGNEIEKAHWVSKVAEVLGVKEEAVWKELARYRTLLDTGIRSEVDSSATRSTSGEVLTKEKLRVHKLEERILGGLFLVPETRDFLKDRDLGLVFGISPHSEIVQLIREEADHDMIQMIQRIPEEWRGYVDRIIFEVEALFYNVKDAKAEILVCILEVERERLKEQLALLAESIGEAERAGDAGRLSSLLGDFKTITERLARLVDRA